MQNAMESILKEIGQRRYGKYRGTVKKNDDPMQIGRLAVAVPSLFSIEELTWAMPCLPFGGCRQQGMFFVPEVGSQVWVEFEEGDVTRPIWTGVFWREQADLPDEAARSVPTTRILQTPSGHKLQFDDAAGERRVRLVHASGSELAIADDGTVQLNSDTGMTLVFSNQRGELILEDSKGNIVRMDDSGWSAEDISGNRIEMASGSITVSATGSVVVDAPSVTLGGHSGEPVLKGMSFLNKYMTHTHTCAPMVGGPTSPPIPQGEVAALSTKVMTG